MSVIIPHLRLRWRLFSILCPLLIPLLGASAQNLVGNASFETDGAAIAAALGDGSDSNADNNINLWNVDVRGSGDYNFLSTIGTFQGGGGSNLVAGLDLASFQLAGGFSAAAAGDYHIDLIGAAVGEVNHFQQRLNSVLNQSVTGLSIGTEYTLSFQYSTTDYVAEPREMAVRIDPEVGGLPDNANVIYSSLVTVGFAPGDPGGIVELGDREQFESIGSVPLMDYSTVAPVDPFDLEDTLRVSDSNALSATTVFDEVAGSTEAPVIVNWQTFTVDFVATAADVRLSFFNNTDPFQQDESDYHYSTTPDGMGRHDIWFGNEVGLLLDDVSIVEVPEPGTFTLLAATALFFLFRRSARRYSEPTGFAGRPRNR